jgi:Rieske Fe-S protein
MPDTSLDCAGCAIAEAMDRRAFMTKTALAAAAVLLAGCGGGSDDGGGNNGIVLPPPGTTFTARVADFGALARVGGVARVITNPFPIALARTGDATYRAYSLICTHQGTPVNINGNNTLTCPNHGAEFAFDGTWTGGAQRTSSLDVLTTNFDAATGVATITI